MGICKSTQQTQRRSLVKLNNIINKNTQLILKEWSKQSNVNASAVPSWAFYNAQQNILAATGSLVEIISDPSLRLMEYNNQMWESRALSIVVARRVPDLLADTKDGVSISDLSVSVGVEERKLARIMRTLCSSHIFREVNPDYFANNRISQALVKNEPLRAYLMCYQCDLFTAADHFPNSLFDKKIGPSYKINETAFQSAIGTEKSRWEWLEEKPEEVSAKAGGYPGVPGEQPPDSSLLRRPEHGLFSLGMVGGGRVTGACHVYDYPWADLGKATVVDVGGGVGGFMIELSKRYPLLDFVVQDRGPFIEQAKTTVWPKENPDALADGKVQFMEHDFFEKNPIVGADVYWFRYIIHDWSDEYCIQILSAVRESMSSTSRVLICEQVMDTTVSTEDKSDTTPLLPNNGIAKRYSHQRDLMMMGSLNGIERTPQQFDDLVSKAGLRIEKIWRCRSQVSIVELRAA